MAHTPSLSEVLPFSKGATSKSLPVKRRYKINQVEQISGVEWYPRFVRNDDVLALSDVIPYEELNKQFLVCVNAPRPADWNKSDKPVRYFAAFKSALDFIHYIKKIPPERWSFFEYILGTQAQKLYFDIDIKQEEFLKVVPGGNIDTFAAGLLTELVRGIVETFEERGLQIDLTRNLLLFSSHSSSKRSFHLIVDGYAVVSNEENYILASEVLEQFPEIYQSFVDTGMYSSKQQFRLYGSQKTGSGRPKIFVENWYYGATLVQSRFYEDLRKMAPDPASFEALKFTALFLASCVTVTMNCQLMSTVIEPEARTQLGRPKFWSETSAFDNDLITPEIRDAIEVRADPRLFQIYRLAEIKGSLIALQRRSGVSNHCSLCQHIHESDNGFLTLDSRGQVYFHCHAFRRHQKRDASGTIIGPTSKVVANVADLLPPSDETSDLLSAHAKSILQQLVRPPIGLPPLVKTRHQEMREIGSRPNSVIKPRAGRY